MMLWRSISSVVSQKMNLLVNQYWVGYMEPMWFVQKNDHFYVISSDKTKCWVRKHTDMNIMSGRVELYSDFNHIKLLVQKEFYFTEYLFCILLSVHGSRAQFIQVMRDTFDSGSAFYTFG